ncbi:MAG: metallophosphoesterase [Verrucomicrobiota bacterium JB022]|nr:metallophosphoesterase [Verrucomicrobiota bacterium JB022]
MQVADSRIPFVPPPAHSLAERLGPGHHAHRLERHRSRKSIALERRNLLQHAGRFLPVNRLVEWGLRATGLYKSARQEFVQPRLVHLEHRCPRWPADLDGLRILHLTDLHADIAPDLVAAVVEGVRGVECDLCVITGDFRNDYDTPQELVLRLNREILAALPQPVYGTLGNHDELELAEPLEATGLIRLLMNEHVVLPFRGRRFTLAGIDDTFFYETGDLAKALDGAPPAEECPRILLQHGPDLKVSREADAAEVAFSPCGHTHGGQLCLPGGRAIVAIDDLPRRVIAGGWREGEMVGYTSRGTGGCRVPARINCPGEITLHTLRPA